MLSPLVEAAHTGRGRAALALHVAAAAAAAGGALTSPASKLLNPARDVDRFPRINAGGGGGGSYPKSQVRLV